MHCYHKTLHYLFYLQDFTKLFTNIILQVFIAYITLDGSKRSRVLLYFYCVPLSKTSAGTQPFSSSPHCFLIGSEALFYASNFIMSKTLCCETITILLNPFLVIIWA